MKCVMHNIFISISSYYTLPIYSLSLVTYFYSSQQDDTIVGLMAGSTERFNDITRHTTSGSSFSNPVTSLLSFLYVTPILHIYSHRQIDLAVHIHVH